MDNDELSDLLARCALRDQRAFGVLYQKTAGYLNTVAYRILRSREASNEVLQEAFVQIWDNAGQYNATQAKVLTWMTTIVRYRAIDKQRQERRHQQRPPSEEEADILENVESTHSPEEESKRYRLNEQVSACLEELNDKFRQCVELAYLQGFSVQELAQSLDANVNTVKTWMRRGAAKLKTCLEGKQAELNVTESND